MNTILDAVAALGHDPRHVTVQGLVRHLPGQKHDSHSGALIDKFEPVAVEVRFMAAGQEAPIMAFANEAAQFIDPDRYWSSQVLPAGIDRDQARALSAALVEDHRVLSGELSNTFAVTESDPAEIEKLVAAQQTLSLPLTQLTAYLAADDRWMGELFQLRPAEPEHRKEKTMRAMFEKRCLEHTFIAQPCSFQAFKQVHAEYLDGNWQAVGFNNFYEWLRESEKRFAPDGTLAKEPAATIGQIVNAWCAASTVIDAGFIERIKSLAMRNFKVHPRHEDAVGAFVEDTIEAFVKIPNSPGARPSA